MQLSLSKLRHGAILVGILVCSALPGHAQFGDQRRQYGFIDSAVVHVCLPFSVYMNAWFSIDRCGRHATGVSGNVVAQRRKDGAFAHRSSRNYGVGRVFTAAPNNCT